MKYLKLLNGGIASLIGLTFCSHAFVIISDNDEAKPKEESITVEEDTNDENVIAETSFEVKSGFPDNKTSGGFKVNSLPQVGDGFWYFSNSSFELELTGTAPTVANVQLKSDWNLVALPINVEIPSDVTVYEYENGEYSLVTDFSSITEGKGYWIYCENDTELLI